MDNQEIAELFRAVAAAYELKNRPQDRFRKIAYENAADAVEKLGTEAKDLWDDGKLESVSGIGPALAKYLGEIFQTGSAKHFKAIFKPLPPGMFELLLLSGIGPKKAYRLAREFKLPAKDPLTKLEKYAKQGKIATLEGFGEESEKDILRAILQFRQRTKNRMLLSLAYEIADQIISWLKSSSEVLEIVPLGSLRRKASTIGDIDLGASTIEPKKVIEHFLRYPGKKRILEQGDKLASILIPGNIRVDLRVHDPKSFGSLVQHFTGSKQHNIALREYALKKGLSLSEYGIKEIAGFTKPASIKNEKEFYNRLGLDWIPPEIREDWGEIELAKNKNLPKLVELEQIKADLQIHTNFNIETSHDVGTSSMKELVKKANELGYEYIAFTEHNPSQSGHSQHQIVEILKRKREMVNKLNNNIPQGSLKKAFNSLEIDILPDGSLPVGEKGLQTLDFALASIHSSFNLGKTKMTKRVLAGLAHPKVKIFAHPTARLLGKREGIELDWEVIFAFCKQKNIWLEINGEPRRLDLPDHLVREAIKNGILLTLGTDAHSSAGMDNMRFAVDVARRGWAEKQNIVNCRGLSSFTKLLE